MKKLRVLFLVSYSLLSAQQKDFRTVFEKGNGNQGATYQQAIAFYELLAESFPAIKIQQTGMTDSGKPLHIVIYNPEKVFVFSEIRKKKAVILINNGIHAGEPDGIDATMMLFRDLATGKLKTPVNTVLVTIPVYNIGGALNRNSTTRANQDGPEEYGFRGNARNFDLNRDFIKADTKNTKSFYEIFHLTDPEIFIDNHVSNGADYQYVLTYIMTQHNKLGQELGQYMNDKLTPAIVSDLKKKKVESTPYVNAWSDTPDKGFAQFFEPPRFATGYTSLFNTIGFVVETHMLKKYPLRVKATYDFMVSALAYTDAHSAEIKEARLKNAVHYTAGTAYPVQWQIDSSKVETISFLGYEGSHKKSDATTGKRLFYDRNKPFNQKIPFYKEYKPLQEVLIPTAYIIPQGWWPVIDLLRINKIEVRQLATDTLIDVESYRIADYKTSPSAYEGHYLHRNTKIISSGVKVKFSKGDYYIPTNQKGVKYLLETLEPEATDSFFNWNFFDTILQQKEGYSDYVFEDLAAELLKENPALQSQLEKKRNSDKAFNDNPEAQLDWIYKNSVYYEKAHLQYPVYRVK
ncbi:MAG TPA: M14 family metallopeptidase [Flavobacterium sp.]|jgi:hypothetical protein